MKAIEQGHVDTSTAADQGKPHTQDLPVLRVVLGDRGVGETNCIGIPVPISAYGAARKTEPQAAWGRPGGQGGRASVDRRTKVE